MITALMSLKLFVEGKTNVFDKYEEAVKKMSKSTDYLKNLNSFKKRETYFVRE